jgi:hypothetical protein
MMQSRHIGREETPTSRIVGSYQGGPPPPYQHPPPHHHGSYRSDMATPIKSSGHPYHQRPTPSSGHMHHPYPGSSASKPAYPSSAQKADYSGSAQKPLYMGREAPPSNNIPLSTGKENKKKTSSPKRSPCNCKKSKCLKLYCECFAAGRFCQGCNCSDCGNTPNAGIAREKAIKDTRAKNPNAFKPRFNVKHLVKGTSPNSGHNMGCRCKRSECLKKYCEVRF